MMFDPTASTRRLPLPARVPAQHREAIERAADELDERQRKADADRRHAADRIRDEFLHEQFYWLIRSVEVRVVP